MSEGLQAPSSINWAASGLSSSYVAKTGDSMSGNLSMGNNAISNVSALAVTGTTNQLTLGLLNTTTISATAPSASRTYTINPIAGNGDFSLISTAGSSKIPISYESVTSLTGTNIAVTAAQLATGILVLTYTGSDPYYLTLPSGADIAANTSLAPFNTAGAVFKVLVTITNVNNVSTLTGATGCNIVGGVNLVFGFSRILYFVAAGNSVWNVY